MEDTSLRLVGTEVHRYAGIISPMISRDVPFAPGGRSLRAVLALRRDPLTFLCRSAEICGDAFRLRATARLMVYVLRSPAAMHHMLVAHPERYLKRSRGYIILRQFLGNGLLTSEGEFWRKQRRIIQPALHRDRIAGFGSTMVAQTEAMLRRWQSLSENKKIVDIDHEMSRLTLQIAGLTLLSADVGGDAEIVGKAVSTLNAWTSRVMLHPLQPPLWVPTSGNRAALRARRSLDRIIYGMIQKRRDTGEDPGDLLSMLMAAVDQESGESMNDEQLRDEVLTMFVAGHETTANALSWALYLLSLHPVVMRQLSAELSTVLGGRPPTIADLPALEFTERVILETMRLYPPAWSIGRALATDDQVDGHLLRSPAVMLISPYLVHRNAAYWPNPSGFDPDRFLPEAIKSRPRYAYLPFSAGPRICIGKAFAMIEMKLVLATLLQRFRPALAPGHAIEPEPLITLRPRRGLPMTIEPA
ncbi:MAG TPA: cytochrome P450 [Nannocystis exedens]|nr:cytochrome P450 [Nannocystis exedens]